MSQPNSPRIISGINQKTGNPYKGLQVVSGQYQWIWWPQECLRFLAVATRINVQAIVEGFVAGKRFQETDVFGYSEYEGHAMLVLRTAKDDGRPLQFGLGKAKALVAMIAEMGLAGVIAACKDIAGDAQPMDRKATKGKAKAKPKTKAKTTKASGGKGKGKGSRPAEDDGDDAMTPAETAAFDRGRALARGPETLPMTPPAPTTAPQGTRTVAAIQAEMVVHMRAMMALKAELAAALAIAV